MLVCAVCLLHLINADGGHRDTGGEKQVENVWRGKKLRLAPVASLAAGSQLIQVAYVESTGLPVWNRRECFVLDWGRKKSHGPKFVSWISRLVSVNVGSAGVPL